MEPPTVRYVTTSDGYRIAYAVSGSGPTLVYMPYAINHIGHVPPPNWGQGLLQAGLASHFQFVRYDTRAQGLSTRGLRPDHSVLAYERDLEAVLDCLQVEQVV